MQKYKIAVSKDQKKYTLVLQADNENLAKERVHKEGYSILSIEKYIKDIYTGKVFCFVGIGKGGEKKGKIIGHDIFKVYTKLKKELGYKVLELYPNEEKESITDEQKKKLLQTLEEEYEIFQERESKNNKKETKLKKQENKKNTQETNIDSFYMKKELEQSYKLIDFVLEKVKNLIDNREINNLDSEQKEKLKTIYNSIIKIKKTTNIHKLKEIGEIALLKVGLLELHELEKSKSKQMKGMLQDTNKLLKQIGSSRQFIEKEKDYKKIIVDKIQQYIQNIFGKEKKKNKKIIDTSSHEYIRTELFIKKYKEKKKENDIFILKNIFKILFDSQYRSDIFLKRKVIKQNLLLYTVKQKGINYSYTAIKTGYITLLEKIEFFIKGINKYIFGIIFFYSLFIFLYINIYPILSEISFIYIYFNFKGLFYFILLIFLYFTLYIRKGFLLLGVNFVILFFIIIFGIINF